MIVAKKKKKKPKTKLNDKENLLSKLKISNDSSEEKDKKPEINVSKLESSTSSREEPPKKKK